MWRARVRDTLDCVRSDSRPSLSKRTAVGNSTLNRSFPPASRYPADPKDRRLIEHKLVPSNMLEELPVSIHSSSMLTAFLSTLVTPSPITGSRQTPITPAASFATLSLPTSTSSFSSSVNPAPLSAPIAALISAMDTHQAHLSTLSFQSRQLTRDRAKLESNPQNLRRRLENEQRAKDGIPLLPLSAEEAALVEPSRLETMLALGAVEGATRALSEASGAAVVRSFGAKGGVENA